MLKNPLNGRAQNSSDNVSDSLSHAIIAGKRIFLTPFVQNLDKFGREPTLVSVEFAHPTVFIFLGNNGHNIIFTEAQFVVISTFKIQNGACSFSLWSRCWVVHFMVFLVAFGRVIRLLRKKWKGKFMKKNFANNLWRWMKCSNSFRKCSWINSLQLLWVWSFGIFFL